MLYILPPLEDSKNELVDDGPRADLPADFAPDQYPILSEQWFGWQPLGDITAEIVRSLELSRGAELAEPVEVT